MQSIVYSNRGATLYLRISFSGHTLKKGYKLHITHATKYCRNSKMTKHDLIIKSMDLIANSFYIRITFIHKN